MTNSANTINDIMTALKFLLRNKNSESVPSKIKQDSGIPNKEFMIILGSNENSAAPRIAYDLSTNLLHKR